MKEAYIAYTSSYLFKVFPERLANWYRRAGWIANYQEPTTTKPEVVLFVPIIVCWILAAWYSLTCLRRVDFRELSDVFLKGRAREGFGARFLREEIFGMVRKDQAYKL